MQGFSLPGKTRLPIPAPSRLAGAKVRREYPIVVKYEVVVVLDAVMSEEEHSALLDKIEGVVTANGGSIESRNIWGKRRLAYPINKKRDGYYVLILADIDPASAALNELDRFLRITEPVLRSLITKAVVGKSTGDASKYDVYERGMQQQRVQRMAEQAERRERRGGGDFRPRREEGEFRPRRDDAAAHAAVGSAPAPAAAAPAEAPAPAPVAAPASDEAPTS
jgi:small subunit ribosomal protein S6